MRRVIIESPYAGPTPEAVARNVRYARACMRDAFMRGEAPFASHLLYTLPGVLDDRIPVERALGMRAGFAWLEVSSATVVYENLGISGGMHVGLERARSLDRPIEYRKLDAIPQSPAEEQLETLKHAIRDANTHDFDAASCIRLLELAKRDTP